MGRGAEDLGYPQKTDVMVASVAAARHNGVMRITREGSQRKKYGVRSGANELASEASPALVSVVNDGCAYAPAADWWDWSHVSRKDGLDPNMASVGWLVPSAEKCGRTHSDSRFEDGSDWLGKDSGLDVNLARVPR